MKRIMHLLLIACLTVLMLSAAAMAKPTYEKEPAKGTYVPVQGNITRVKDGKTESGTVWYSFTTDGRIKSYVETWPEGTINRSYLWDKNRVASKCNTFPDGTTEKTTYTYTKKTRVVEKWERNYSNGKHVIATYTWDRKGGSGTYVQETTSSDGQGHTSYGTCKADKKGRLTQQTISRNYGDNGDSNTADIRSSQKTYTYYKDGKGKSVTQNGNLVWSGTLEQKITYNKAGYKTSQTDKKDDGTTRTYSYQYTNARGRKCPKKIVVTITDNGNITVLTYEFTNFKKVTRVRNCDDWGWSVHLGANIIS